jgi:hypothetical protein
MHLQMIRQQQQQSASSCDGTSGGGGGGGGPFNVVEFCQSTGIPLSRMLRLDLMRLEKSSSSTSNQQCRR